MIDWHCHILPGVDDGPATFDEAVSMGRGLRQAGFTRVCCTPHLIRGWFEADHGKVRDVLALLQSRLDAEGIDLELLPGREYALDEYLFRYLEEPQPLGDTGYLLVEVPGRTTAEFAREAFLKIRERGFIPMIAHPERSPLFGEPGESARPGVFNPLLEALHLKGREADHSWSGGVRLLEYLASIGCSFQGDLGSLAGCYGETARRRASRFKASGIYTHWGTDLHGPGDLPGITEALAGVPDAKG